MKKKIIDCFFLFILLAPIFVTKYGIYNDYTGSTALTSSTNSYEFSKNILRPLPLSIFLSLLFFIYYFFKFFKKKFNIAVSIYFIVLAIITLINILEYNSQILRILYLLQFILTGTALYFGYYYKIDKKLSLNFIVFFILIFITNTLYIMFKAEKLYILDKNLFFTIYQNSQYVQSIIVLISFIPLLTNNKLKNIFKICILILTAVYALLSWNSSTFFIYIFGTILFVIKNKNIKFILFLSTILIFLCLFFLKNINNINIKSKLNPETLYKNKNITDLFNFKVPDNFVIRIKIYEELIKIDWSLKYFLTGRENLNFIQKYYSSHNYFIDIFIIFGIIPILLLLYSLLYIKNLKYYKNNYYNFFIPLFIFYLLVENLSKTSLKQPYSGIISFYFIGLILAEFQKKN
jgi:hypothetical protein